MFQLLFFPTRPLNQWGQIWLNNRCILRPSLYCQLLLIIFKGIKKRCTIRHSGFLHFTVKNFFVGDKSIHCIVYTLFCCKKIITINLNTYKSPPQLQSCYPCRTNSHEWVKDNVIFI